MRWWIPVSLMCWCAAHAQSGPGIRWQATPLQGFAEFHGLLASGDRLLAWGDAGADSVRAAVACWFDGETGETLGSWRDTRSRSRFWGSREDEGGFLLVGEARRGDGPSRPMLLRLDQQGDSLWLREPDWGGDCVLRAVVPLTAGGWLVGGERDHQALLARLDGQGDTLWTREFEFFPEYDDVFYDVDELADGRLVACGQTYHDSHEWTSRYAVLAWFDMDGALLDLFQPYDAQMFDVEPLADGRMALTGDFQFAYLPVWLGTSSQDMTHHYFGVRERDMQGTAIRACPDGGLAVGGRWQTAEGEMAALLLRLDSQGEELWRMGYDVCGIDMGWGLVSGDDGSHRLAGFCMPSRTAFVLATHSEGSPVAPPHRQTTEDPRMAVDWAGIQLRWERPVTEAMIVELFNLAGQRVSITSIAPGRNVEHLRWDTLAAGAYVLRLSSPTTSLSWLVPWQPR